MKSVIQQSLSKYLIQWYPTIDPNNILTHYTVYYKSGFNIRRHQTLLTETIIESSSFNEENLRIVANGKNGQTHTVLLPSVGSLKSKKLKALHYMTL